jgi:hypothetical protein
MEATAPPFSFQDQGELPVELCKSKVPLRTIRAKLQILERCLKCFLAHVKTDPDQPLAKRKKGSSAFAKVMAYTLQAIGGT